MKLLFSLLTSLILFCANQAVAQYEFIPDMTGKSITDAKYVDLTGTPYFIDQWVAGEVKLADGKIVKPAELKFDMVEDKLLFRADNKTFAFTPPVLSFKLFTPSGEKYFLRRNDDGSYLQVLNTGNAKLLKKNRKSILEAKGYNSANVNKTVDENKKYFVVYKGKETEVKLTKKSFLEKFPEHATQINAFDFKLSKQNIEDGYGKLVDTF